MISTYHKARKQRGAATLIIALFLLVSITLIILFAASFSLMQSKVTQNNYQYEQAYEAAEAGLEFGIVYLQQNNAVITASPVNGYIPAYSSANTQNVVLTDNAQFTIAYTNPTQNNYNLIKVSSTGTSSDGTSVITMSQYTYSGSELSTPPNMALITKGSVTLSGNVIIANPNGTSTIDSASTISFTGNAETTIQNGVVGSNSATKGPDITQNNATLAAMSNATFFQSYFGATEASVQAIVAHSYTNSNSTSYNSLNGMSGTSIWITQTGGTASISGNVTIGTAANPVLMIVNGNLSLSGNVNIYGFIYVIGGVSTSLSGNINIVGGIVSTDVLTISGNTTVTYSSTVLSSLQGQMGASYFAKVPGSWRDF